MPEARRLMVVPLMLRASSKRFKGDADRVQAPDQPSAIDGPAGIDMADPDLGATIPEAPMVDTDLGDRGGDRPCPSKCGSQIRPTPWMRAA